MGGARRERRAAAAAAAAAGSAEEAIRLGCEKALRLQQEGDTAGASDLALKLVDNHPKSAAACNLVGFLMESWAAKLRDQLQNQDANRVRSRDADADADRARAAEREAAISHLASYQEACIGWYQKASHLAPRCAFTRARYARMLSMCDRIAEAHHEFSSAVNIRNPEVPDRNNPWVRSTELLTDEDKKATAIAMARDDFSYFLHLWDTRVYTASRELLYSLRKGTPGVKAKNEARDLAAKYPFSARAKLLAPYLMRSCIDSSSSAIPKVQQYKEVLREVAECVDLFPASIVISLFRAEVLFVMGRYLDAALECLRGLQITRPDDPVSQDVPPGSASGSGRTGRTETVIAKLIDVLEQSQEKVVDAQEIEKLKKALGLTPQVDECLVKELVEELNRSLLQDLVIKAKPAQLHPSTSSNPIHFLAKIPEGKKTAAVEVKKKQTKMIKESMESTDIPKLNPDAGKDDKGKSGVTVLQSLLYNNKYQKFTKKKREAVSPLQIMGNRTVPWEIVDVYADYCFLRSTCPERSDVCHLCVFEIGKYYANAIPRGNMILHCQMKHQTRTIKCDVYECDVRCRTEDEKEHHHHYCHVLAKDWWRQWPN